MTDFDRIAASVPVSKKDAMTAAKGEHYSLETSQIVWDACPPLRADFANFSADIACEFVGKVQGRMTILGVVDKPARNSRNYKAHWACKCKCGQFFGLKLKRIREGVDRCQACAQVAIMRGEKVTGYTIEYSRSTLKWVRV